MTNEKDAWQHYMQRHASIRDAHTPTILQRHQTADDQTHLMLNALLLLNGGGLAAIPALKAIVGEDVLKLESLALSGAIFFGGLTLAIIAGVASIWNFRMQANNLEAEMSAQLQENNELMRTKLVFTPSNALLEARQVAKRIGRKSIPITFVAGWVAGVLSAIFFAVGGATLGGKFNPICQWLGPFCFTATG